MSSGFYPAFEKDQKLASTENCVTEFDCARQIHAFLKSTSADVDAHLTLKTAAMSKAMTTLIEQDLEPTTLFTTWCEKEGFKHYKVHCARHLILTVSAVDSGRLWWETAFSPELYCG